MLKQLQAICHILEDGEDLVQATIIKHAGSTPRSVGSKMFIRRDGSVIGTIGGGLVEFEMQKTCPRDVYETGKARIEAVDLSGKDAATTDQMICGGRLEFLLEYLPGDPAKAAGSCGNWLPPPGRGKGLSDQGAGHEGRYRIAQMEHCLVQERLRGSGKFFRTRLMAAAAYGGE